MKKNTRTSSADSAGNSLFWNERSLSGDRIGTSPFYRVAVIQSQQASRITWHAHDHFELLFLSEGATSYEFAEQKTVELPGGHFLVIPPGIRHRGLFNVRHPVRLCGMMLNLEGNRRQQYVPFSQREIQWIHAQCLEGALAVCRMSSELRRDVNALSQWISNPMSGPLSSAAIRMRLCSILIEAAQQLTNQRTTKPSFTVEAAKKFMDHNYVSPISMDDVAASSNCSRARLFHIFKESTGMTPNDYLQRMRIKKSQEALLTTQQPITTIALNSGFSTSQYFSTVFRKYTGLSPAEFRHQRNESKK